MENILCVQQKIVVNGIKFVQNEIKNKFDVYNVMIDIIYETIHIKKYKIVYINKYYIKKYFFDCTIFVLFLKNRC